jgi:hypothetical protein
VELGDAPEPLRAMLELGLRRDPATRPAAPWFATSLASWSAEPEAALRVSAA